MKQSNGVYWGRFLQTIILSVSTLLFAALAVAQNKPIIIPLFETAEIDPTLVQTRVSGTCTLGSFITSIAEDGSVTCGKSGTAAVFSANGFDPVPDVPVVDQQRFWLDQCITPSYVAGAGETALVTATVGLTLSGPIQGDVLLSSFEGGSSTPTGHGNGLLWAGQSNWDITVVHHINLTEGVAYRFGATIFPQGGGTTRSRLVCSTMVQIVRVTP